MKQETAPTSLIFLSQKCRFQKIICYPNNSPKSLPMKIRNVIKPQKCFYFIIYLFAIKNPQKCLTILFKIQSILNLSLKINKKCKCTILLPIPTIPMVIILLSFSNIQVPFLNIFHNLKIDPSNMNSDNKGIQTLKYKFTKIYLNLQKYLFKMNKSKLFKNKKPS